MTTYNGNAKNERIDNVTSRGNEFSVNVPKPSAMPRENALVQSTDIIVKRNDSVIRTIVTPLGSSYEQTASKSQKVGTMRLYPKDSKKSLRAIFASVAETFKAKYEENVDIDTVYHAVLVKLAKSLNFEFFANVLSFNHSDAQTQRAIVKAFSIALVDAEIAAIENQEKFLKRANSGKVAAPTSGIVEMNFEEKVPSQND